MDCKLVLENVGIICGESVAHVCRKIEGAHHETVKDSKHWLECHCVIFAEGLNQHQSHLKDVLEELNAFGSLISPLREVDVLLNFNNFS